MRGRDGTSHRRGVAVHLNDEWTRQVLRGVEARQEGRPSIHERICGLRLDLTAEEQRVVGGEGVRKRGAQAFQACASIACSMPMTVFVMAAWESGAGVIIGCSVCDSTTERVGKAASCCVGRMGRGRRPVQRGTAATAHDLVVVTAVRDGLRALQKRVWEAEVDV